MYLVLYFWFLQSTFLVPTLLRKVIFWLSVGELFYQKNKILRKFVSSFSHFWDFLWFFLLLTTFTCNFHIKFTTATLYCIHQSYFDISLQFIRKIINATYLLLQIWNIRSLPPYITLWFEIVGLAFFLPTTFSKFSTKLGFEVFTVSWKEWGTSSEIEI